jgi:hypothetical protein
MIELAIGIVHMSVVLIEQNAVPNEIIVPQSTNPNVFCFISENARSISPIMSRYAKISR